MNDGQLRQIVSALVRGGNLETLSAKKIREHLEGELHVDLSERKKDIDDWVMAALNEHATVFEQSATQVLETVSSKKNLNNLEDESSNEENHKKKRRETESHDYALAKKLQDSELFSLRPRTPIKKRSINSQSTRTSFDRIKNNDENPQRRQTGFNKPLLLSPALSATLDGVVEMSRPAVVKALWKYIKERDLQDPNDKRYILCDERLTQLFGHSRVSTFKMNKYLVPHMKYQGDVV